MRSTFSRLLPEVSENKTTIHMAIIDFEVIAYGYLTIIRGKEMFEMITDLIMVTAIALIGTMLFMACVQYSEFTAHFKAHEHDTDPKSVELASKFAWLPYFVIPTIGTIVATYLGLCATEYAIAHAYIGTTATPVFAIVSSVVIYGIIDHTFLSKIGDTAYFRLIERKFRNAVDEPVDSEPEKQEMSQEELIVLLSKVLAKK